MPTGVLVSSDSRMDRFWSARGKSTLQPPPSPLPVRAKDHAAELKRAVEVFDFRGRRPSPVAAAVAAAELCRSGGREEHQDERDRDEPCAAR